jgi:glucose/arabinose dehydrogenase
MTASVRWIFIHFNDLSEVARRVRREKKRLDRTQQRYRGAMRRFLAATMALTALLSCGDEKGPTPSPFGLDVRPTNPSCIARKRPVIDTGVALQRRWPQVEFAQPLYLTQAPNDDTQWYVVERGGKIRTFADSATVDGDLREFASVPVNDSGEGGLLGFAFHPSWPAKREAYLSYTRNVAAGDPAPPSCPGSGRPFTSVIARYQSSNNGLSLNLGPDEFLEVGQPYTNHDGGNIQFGLDGMLYIGLGDGGSGDDPCNSGQTLTSLLGKMLRIDINAPAGTYNIPADNPFFADATAKKEIWASGLRNPWRWSFDKASGELWLGDVGQGTWEEIDRVVKGGNYGWKPCEGFHRRGSTTALCETPGLIDPVVAHPRGEARSITGGYVYHGTAMPSLVGTYIYGDFATGNIWALTYDAANKPTPTILTTVEAQTLVSFAQGNDGEIYTVQINGILSKLVPIGSPPPDDFPRLLSELGCMNPGDARKPGPALIPYDVNSQLWADGADKERFFAIPDGTTIDINPEQDWELPVGSVVIKTFGFGNNRLETRVFMRHDDGGWGGYTYEWNEQGRDAVLLPAGKVKSLDRDLESWAYPSRPQCIQCHSLAAGGTLATWCIHPPIDCPISSRPLITSGCSRYRCRPSLRRRCGSRIQVEQNHWNSEHAPICMPTVRTAIVRWAARRARWTCGTPSCSRTPRPATPTIPRATSTELASSSSRANRNRASCRGACTPATPSACHRWR